MNEEKTSRRSLCESAVAKMSDEEREAMFREVLEKGECLVLLEMLLRWPQEEIRMDGEIARLLNRLMVGI